MERKKKNSLGIDFIYSIRWTKCVGELISIIHTLI